MCPPVRLIAWLSGSGAHKVGAETPRRRRHVLGVAAQAARCSNAMRAINGSPTRGHPVAARRFGLVVGVAGRLAPSGVRSAGCFEASNAQNDRMPMAAALRCRRGNARGAWAHEWWHSQCSCCEDASCELSLRGEGTATARAAVPWGAYEAPTRSMSGLAFASFSPTVMSCSRIMSSSNSVGWYPSPVR